MEGILAVDIKNGISKNGVIPWHSPIDMKHFYEKTEGNIVIMGSKTYFSIPEKYRPLKNRLNIVLTSIPHRYMYDYDVNKHENLLFTNNENIHLNIFENIKNGMYQKLYPLLNKNLKMYIIGGKQIYNKYISLCDKVWVTQVKYNHDCDLFFDYNFDKLFGKKEYYSDDNISVYCYYKKL